MRLINKIAKNESGFQGQTDIVGEEGRVRGRVWGSPAGADDDAAPPPATTRRSLRARGNLKQPTHH